MQSEGNDIASPRPNSRRQHNNNKQNRQTHNHHEVLSDSNLPNATTPKSRKTPRHNQHGDRSTSTGASTAHPSGKNRPASMAVPQSAVTPSKPSYAGAAFHASPAPSSLPVPRFFSKSVPQANADSGLQARMERDAERPDSNGAGKQTLAPPSARNDVKSPLDMFFSADRQEKARKQNASSSDVHLPTADSRSHTPSKPRDMFMLELDEASSPAGNHLSTPTSVRRQPTAERSRTAPDNVPTVNSEEARRAQQTESLKSFLHITGNEAPNATPPRSPFQTTTPQHQPFSTPSQSTALPDPSLHYGNRNLSPLFHAARSPEPRNLGYNPTSPGQHHNNMSSYASVYQNQYNASPSRSPAPPNGHYYNQQHNPPQQPQYQQYPVHSPMQNNAVMHTPPRAIPVGGGDGAGDVRDMEERMKRMLKMG